MTIEVAGRQVAVTNLDRVLWPQTGYTKRDLLDYYAALAPYIVPHLAGRPVMLGRWPHGVEERGWGQFDWSGEPGAMSSCASSMTPRRCYGR
jgi:bifunctional non-homologous end joining protein LigD